MDNLYEFPREEIQTKALNVLNREINIYLKKCFENVGEIIEPNIQSFLLQQFGHKKIEDILSIIAKNEQIGFDERVIRAMENMSEDTFLVGDENFKIKNNQILIPVNSLTYFMSEDDTIKYQTVINDSQYLVNKLLNITNVKRINKKSKVIFIKDDSGSMGVFENKGSSMITHFITNLMKLIYDEVETNYITHGTDAQIVNAVDFETNNKSGGTIVSSGYKKAWTLIEDINTNEIDTFFIHLSDGDNLTSDNPRVVDIIRQLNEKNVNCFYFEVNQYRRSSTLMNAFRNFKSEKFQYTTLEYSQYLICVIRDFIEKVKQLHESLEFKHDKLKLYTKVEEFICIKYGLSED